MRPPQPVKAIELGSFRAATPKRCCRNSRRASSATTLIAFHFLIKGVDNGRDVVPHLSPRASPFDDSSAAGGGHQVGRAAHALDLDRGRSALDLCQILAGQLDVTRHDPQVFTGIQTSIPPVPVCGLNSWV
jgi:hypothetical protein